MIVGIETGGTKTVCAAGTGPTDIVEVVTFPTDEPEATLTAVARFVTKWRESHGVEGIGIGSFGPVDLDKLSPSFGRIGASPKLAWRGADVVGPLALAAGAPVAIETDVTAAAIGELRWGAGVGLTDLAYVTVGTGIGVGAVVQGRPLHGTAHPEAGHLLVRRHSDDDFPGVCPLHGDCLEGLASGSAVTARWGRPGTELRDLLGRAVEVEAYYLAQLVTSLIYMISPARIVLGGGVLGTPGLLEAVRERTAPLLGGALGAHPASDPASGFLSLPRLGGQAGVVGALTMAADLAGNRPSAVDHGRRLARTALPPLLLESLLVPKPWGGRRLGELGRMLPSDMAIGESWDLADLDPEMTPVPDPISRIAGGSLAGRTLREVVARSAAELLGPGQAHARRFPLLIKHLDARENLSVQVHPPAEQVARHPGIHLKTESWVVIAAEPGSGLYLGVLPGVTVDDVERALGTPELIGLLGWVPARVGDIQHVPAGLIHAVGAGVLVAEVQTPSDTTFRLYDWVEEYGRAPRELQLELGLEAIRSQWDMNVNPPATVSHEGLAVDTDHYTITGRRAAAMSTLAVATRAVARVVLVMSGELRITGADASLGPGRLAVLPASWSGDLTAEEGSAWLDIDLSAPVPLESEAAVEAFRQAI